MHPDKRRELEKELAHEDEWNKREAAKPKLKGYFFYNVPSNDKDTAAAYGVKQLKSGKWAMAIYDKSGNSTYFRKQKADEAFGPGKWWSPNDKKKTNEDTMPQQPVPGQPAGKITQVTGKDITIDNNGTKTTIDTTKPGAANVLTRDASGKLTLHPDQLQKLQTASPQQQQQPIAKVGDQVSTDPLSTIKKNAGVA